MKQKLGDSTSGVELHKQNNVKAKAIKCSLLSMASKGCVSKVIGKMLLVYIEIDAISYNFPTSIKTEIKHAFRSHFLEV